MEQIREMIFTVCMCAMLNAGIRLLSPDKLQKEVRIVCTLMLILCMAARTLGGFRIDTEAFFSSGCERQSRYTEDVLTDTEEALISELESRLEHLGINNARVGIVCTFDEYNYIRADKVFVRLPVYSEEDLQLAQNAAKELFPEAETEVTADDENAERVVLR